VILSDSTNPNDVDERPFGANWPAGQFLAQLHRHFQDARTVRDPLQNATPEPLMTRCLTKFRR
jgi:hypothetical protein